MGQPQLSRCRHSAQLGAMEGITSPDILSTFSGRKIRTSKYFRPGLLDPPFVSAPHSQYSHKIELRIALLSAGLERFENDTT